MPCKHSVYLVVITFRQHAVNNQDEISVLMEELLCQVFFFVLAFFDILYHADKFRFFIEQGANVVLLDDEIVQFEPMRAVHFFDTVQGHTRDVRLCFVEHQKIVVQFIIVRNFINLESEDSDFCETYIADKKHCHED